MMKGACKIRAGVLSLLTLAAVLSAQTPATPTDPAEVHRLAQQYVNEKIALWQGRLKLGAWRISAQSARATELKPGTMGATRWDKPKKTAVIFVLDPADYKLPFREMLDDMELTVVHELVHLELTSLPRGEASRGGDEQAVSGLADALLQLDRTTR